MNNLPPLPAIFRFGTVPAFTPPPLHLEETSVSDHEMMLSSVDDLFEVAELSEEDEWDVKMWLARGRAKLEAA